MKILFALVLIEALLLLCGAIAFVGMVTILETMDLVDKLKDRLKHGRDKSV